MGSEFRMCEHCGASSYFLLRGEAVLRCTVCNGVRPVHLNEELTSLRTRLEAAERERDEYQEWKQRAVSELSRFQRVPGESWMGLLHRLCEHGFVESWRQSVHEEQIVATARAEAAEQQRDSAILALEEIRDAGEIDEYAHDRAVLGLVQAHLAASPSKEGDGAGRDKLRELQDAIHKLTDDELSWLEIIGRGTDFDHPDFAIEHHTLGLDGSESHQRYEGKNLLDCLRKALAATDAQPAQGGDDV